MSTMRRIGLVTIVVLMVAAGVLLIGGGAASAHAFLVRTVPPSGARLDRGPSELVLEFTEALEARPVVVVRTISGTRIDGLRAVASDDRAIVRVALSTLRRGVYVVGWEGVADDGHRSEGTWAFAVGDVAGVTIPAPAQSQQPGSPLVVLLTWIGLLLLAVSATSATGAGSLRVAGLVRRAPFNGAAYGWIGAAVVVLAVRVAVVAGSSGGVGVSDALSSRGGRLGFASVAFAGAAFCVARWKAAGVVLLSAATASVVASGHVLGPGRAWVGVVTVVHALLGMWWVASLAGVLAAVGWQPDRLGERVRVHSRRAVVIVPVAVAAGLATALGRLPTLATLADTTYGRWVIVKAALIAAALAAAVLVRRSAITRTIKTVDVAANSSALPAGSVALSPRWVRVLWLEMVMIVAGVGAGVVLSSVAPPRERVLVDLGPSPVPAPTVTMAALSGNHQLVVQAGPGRLQVRLLAPGSQPPLRTTAMHVRGDEPDLTSVDWQPRTCGTGCIEVDHAWRTGTTVLHVETTGSDGGNATSMLNVAWPPVDASSEAATALTSFRAVPMVHVRETDGSGPGAVGEPYTFDLSGGVILDQSPIPRRTAGVVGVDDGHGGRLLRMWAPGSSTWIELHTDERGRIASDVIIDPGHRIDRTYEYP